MAAANIIALRGSVRDLAAAPDDGILAVVADTKRDVPAAALLLLGSDGRVRAELRPYMIKREEADEAALETRIQRVGTNDFAVFGLRDGSVRVLRLAATSRCTGDVLTRDDGVFLYPQYGDVCYGATLKRLSSFATMPKEAEGLKDVQVVGVHMNDAGSLSVARQAFDGKQTRMLLTTYGHGRGAATSVHTGLWRGVRLRDGVAEAVQVQSDGSVVEVNVAVP